MYFKRMFRFVCLFQFLFLAAMADAANVTVTPVSVDFGFISSDATTEAWGTIANSEEATQTLTIEAPGIVRGGVRVGTDTRILSRDGGDLEVGNTGTPEVSIDCGKTLDLGEQEIFLGRKGCRVSVENYGDAPLLWTGSKVSISGPDAEAFTIFPSTSTLDVIWPNTKSQFTVYLNPDTPRTYSAEMTITTNAASDPSLKIGLTGTGVLPKPQNWTQYGGGPEHRGRQYFNATVTRLDSPAWINENQGLMTASMPCLIEDADSTVPVRVYAWGTDAADYSATQAFVKCFNGETGELLWTSDPITSIGYTVSYGSWHSVAADKASGRVFLGMGAHLYCYDALSGALIWQSDPLRADSGDGLVVNATVTVGCQYVYQSTYTGFGGSCYLQAFNISDGKEAWVDVRAGQGQETVVYHEDGARSVLYRMISGDSSYSGGAGVVCLDAEDGSLVWSSEKPLDGSPAWKTSAGNANFGGITFHDGLILAPTYNFSAPADFVCLDAYTGALKWLVSGTAPNSDGAPVVVGDRVYVAGHYFYGEPSYLTGFDLHSGQKVYERKVSTDSNMCNVTAGATSDRIYVTEGSAIFSPNSKGLHMLFPDRDDVDATSRTALTERIRGSVAIGSNGAVYGFLDTVPPSMLGGLVCYRVPEADTIRFLDQDVPTTDSYTRHPEITVLHQARWATEMRVYEAGETPGEWMPYSTRSTWTLSSGEGNKTLYAEYQNGSGEAQAPVSGSIWVGTPRIQTESVKIRDQDGDMPPGHTNDRTVVVEVPSEGATEILIREANEEGTWQNYSPATRFTVTAEFGVKTLFVKIRNAVGESQESVGRIELHASPYATEVVAWEGQLGGEPYHDPNAVLGSPTRRFLDPWSMEGPPVHRVKLVESAYNTDADGNPLLTTLKDGASITVKFDHMVLDDPQNPFGIDLLVFGNASYANNSFVSDLTDMNECQLIGGIYDEPTTVSVSQDGKTWYTFNDGPFADSSFPTNAYGWDEEKAVWTDQPSDFTKPVDPALETTLAAGGITAARAIELYAGSGGGTGFDIGKLGLDWIQYVRVTGRGGEIDAFSDVSATSRSVSLVSLNVYDADGDMPEGQTNRLQVGVSVKALDATEMKIWEKGTEGVWVPYSTTSTFTLSPGDGIKTVYFRVRNAQGESMILSDTIRVIYMSGEYDLTVNAVNGSVSKSPDQATYTYGTAVSLTALSEVGYCFAGWTGDITASDNPLILTIDSTKTLTANFESIVPTSVTAEGNTYRVLVRWAPVNRVTSYRVTRTSSETLTTWTVGAVNEFADDTAVPGVPYSYTVAVVDAQGRVGIPSQAATASVTEQTVVASNYKVTAKGYEMLTDTPTTGSLTFRQLDGEKPGTIKILKAGKVPSLEQQEREKSKGIYYLTDQGEVATLVIVGDLKTLRFDVPVYSLESSGLIQSLSAQSVTHLSAAELGKVLINATTPSALFPAAPASYGADRSLFARTFIETTGNSTTMAIQVTGAILEEVSTTQPVKTICVASKVYKDSRKVKYTSLGGVGSLPAVVADAAGTKTPASEATPSSIRLSGAPGRVSTSVKVTDGSVVADKMSGAIGQVTATGGNIRCGLIQSSTVLTLVRSTAKKIDRSLSVGGAVGRADATTAMVVKAQPLTDGKVAIKTVYGQTGVSGYFYAGYDAETGYQNHQGGIGTLQTKTGIVNGVAYLKRDLEKYLKILPKKNVVHAIRINPDL